jgi:hypothetical protein
MARNGYGSYGNSSNYERLFEEFHSCLFATQIEKGSFPVLHALRGATERLRAEARSVSKVQRELAEGADIDQVDEIGCTALPFNQDG